MSRVIANCLKLSTLALTASAVQANEHQSSAALAELENCRDVMDSNARLSCFDREMQILSSAIANGEIMVTDEKQLASLSDGLFGRQANSLRNAKPQAQIPEINSLDSTIERVRLVGRGLWQLDVQGAGTWTQTQSANLVKEPKAGMPVELRKASLGSYFVKIDGQRAVRMRRTN